MTQQKKAIPQQKETPLEKPQPDARVVQQLTPEQALQNIVIFIERGITKGNFFNGMQEVLAANQSIEVLAILVHKK